MTEPRRGDSLPADAPGTGRDARVEALLVEGLDRYFLGQYEEAIHLWTRVLFLDRAHASARAYIDRARGAIAERQRRAEEALQQAAALLDQGRIGDARRRLQQASSALGEDERTAALRLRLERMERVAIGTPRIRAAVEPAAHHWRRRLSDRLTLRSWLAAAVVVVATVVLISSGAHARLGVGPEPAAPAPTLAPAPVHVLTSVEVALVRARSLYARGRLAEALVVLDRVGAEQAARGEADTLRVEIQRLLLAAAGEGRLLGDGRQGPR